VSLSGLVKLLGGRIEHDDRVNAKEMGNATWHSKKLNEIITASVILLNF